MEWTQRFDLFLACVLFSLLAGLLCDMALRRYIKQAGKPPVTAGIVMVVTAVFTGIYGFTLTVLRCVLLCHILILAGAADIATREIPDIFHLLIAMVGLVGFQPFSALMGFLLVPLPFLAAALKTGKIGGGDVKLMAASGFALGVRDGFWMMVWGLAMALVWNQCRHWRRKTVSTAGASIPLAPFLAFGCFMTLLANA